MKNEQENKKESGISGFAKGTVSYLGSYLWAPVSTIEMLEKIQDKQDKCSDLFKTLHEMDMSIARLTMHETSSVPRPCGEIIPCGLLLWMFEPKRTNARKEKNKLLEEKQELLNTNSVCFSNKK